MSDGIHLGDPAGLAALELTRDEYGRGWRLTVTENGLEAVKTLTEAELDKLARYALGQIIGGMRPTILEGEKPPPAVELELEEGRQGVTFYVNVYAHGADELGRILDTIERHAAK